MLLQLPASSGRCKANRGGEDAADVVESMRDSCACRSTGGTCTWALGTAPNVSEAWQPRSELRLRGRPDIPRRPHGGTEEQDIVTAEPATKTPSRSATDTTDASSHRSRVLHPELRHPKSLVRRDTQCQRRRFGYVETVSSPRRRQSRRWRYCLAHHRKQEWTTVPQRTGCGRRQSAEGNRSLPFPPKGRNSRFRSCQDRTDMFMRRELSMTKSCPTLLPSPQDPSTFCANTPHPITSFSSTALLTPIRTIPIHTLQLPVAARQLHPSCQMRPPATRSRQPPPQSSPTARLCTLGLTLSYIVTSHLRR